MRRGSTTYTTGINDNMVALIVFAKEPVPGMVKTRIAGESDDETAMRIYRELLSINSFSFNNYHLYCFLGSGLSGLGIKLANHIKTQ